MDLPELINAFYVNELKLQPLESRMPDPDLSIYNHYHSVTNNSQRILCCFGDSYTKGDGLTSDQYRLTQVFGAVASKKLNSDWFNAGGSGYGNCWMLCQLEFMIDWLNQSHYTGGTIVLTFTENGRDIRTYSHRPFDYINAYSGLPVSINFYNQVCADIEQEWIARLTAARKKLSARFQIIVGMNFIWHDVLEKSIECIPGVDLIDQSWIELLAQSSGVSAPPRTAITHLDSVGILNTILKIKDESHYKQWYLNNATKSEQVIMWMRNNSFFGPFDWGHPNAQGHEIWANKIIELT